MKKSDWTWDRHAEAFLHATFLPRAKGQAFLVEQFRLSVEKAKLPTPANTRSWGAFIQRMKRAGVVRATGYRLDCFGSPKTLWRAV